MNDAYETAQRIKQAEQAMKLGTQTAVAGCLLLILPTVGIMFLVGILMVVFGG